MKTSTPSCSAFAQNGWNFGSLISRPSTLPPMAAPRRPYFFTPAYSCRAARSGCCSATEAKATKRSGCAAQASASFSFCVWITFSARSRSSLYQLGLMLSTCRSMPCASIAAMRCAAVVAMCRSGRSEGPPSLSPMRASASGTAQCACTSITRVRLPETMVSRRAACAPAGRAASRSQPTKARPASAPVADPRNSRRLVMLPPPGICGCRSGRRQQPQQLMRLGVEGFALGAHRDVLVLRPGLRECAVVVRQDVARLAARVDVERFLQVREVVDGAQAGGVAIGEGLGIVVEIVAPYVHRESVAGRGHVDVEEPRKQGLSAQGPVL